MRKIITSFLLALCLSTVHGQFWMPIMQSLEFQDHIRVTDSTYLDGIIAIPSTTSDGFGAITQNGSRLLHTYSSSPTKNIFLGINSGNYTTSGYNNVGIGGNALDALTTGNQNVSIGILSGSNITTGRYNTILGPYAGNTDLVAGEYNVFIGMNAGVGFGDLSNRLIIDKENATGSPQPLIWGDFEQDTITIGGDLKVKGKTYIRDYLALDNDGSPFDAEFEVHMRNATENGEIVIDNYNGFKPVFAGRSNRGTIGSPSATQNGDFLVELAGGGYGSTVFSNSATGAIRIAAVENWSDAAMGTAVQVMTTDEGSNSMSANTTFRNGNLGISDNDPQNMLSINARTQFDSNGFMVEYGNSTPSNGEILIGNTSTGMMQKSTITAGDGVTVTNGAGSITISSASKIPVTTAIDNGIPSPQRYHDIYVNKINQTTQSDVEAVLPYDCAISDLYIITTAAQPADGDFNFTLMVDGVSTSLSVTISASSPAGTYSNTSSSVSVSAGSKICWTTNTTSASPTDVKGLSFLITSN